MAIVVGCIVTILVQSSSVVVSVLTPLAGVGAVTLDRVFPMMLGANLGTTSTAMLAAFSASGNRIAPTFQIALCHLFFNLTGLLIWYPLPFMRRVPLTIAGFFGKTTAKYRWYAFAYLLVMFFFMPLCVFALSLAGSEVLVGVVITFSVVTFAVAIINVLQSKRPQWLPRSLRTWSFLPKWMRSLQPLDDVIMRLVTSCCCSCCRRAMSQGNDVEQNNDVTVTTGKSREQHELVTSTDENV